MTLHINDLQGGAGWGWTQRDADVHEKIHDGPARVFGLRGFTRTGGTVTVQCYDDSVKKLAFTWTDAQRRLDPIFWPGGILILTSLFFNVTGFAGTGNAGVIFWRPEV